MSLVTRIKELCKEKDMSLQNLETETSLGINTIYKWDKAYPSADKLQKVADYFDVSVDYLLGRPNVEDSFNSRDRRDVAKTLEELKEQLINEQGLMFDGDPLSPEALESILNATQMGLEIAKIRNKEKYTPKKYRKPKE